MKKVCAVTALLFICMLVLAGMACAQTGQPNWRIYIQADDGNNGSYIQGTTAGVSSSAADDYGVDYLYSDVNDQFYSFTSPMTPKSMAFVFEGHLWKNDIKSPRWPGHGAYVSDNGEKRWQLRAFGYGQADTATPIRIKFQVISSTVQPPVYMPNSTHRIGYGIRMVNNRNVDGAPANGTVWTFDVPITPQTANYMMFSLNLPTINLTVKDAQHAIDEGYALEFFQAPPVPEPLSLLALSSGILGLAGYSLRRRKR